MASKEQLFTGLTPLIQVFDMTKALAFYRDSLGFEVLSASPEVETSEGRFSHWMWLRLGSADLMLNTQFDSDERPPKPFSTRNVAHADTAFYISCSDIDAAYACITRQGALIEPPRLASYGLRSFCVKDPDGYSVIFQESNR
jgi:glyoxylase I family protein